MSARPFDRRRKRRRVQRFFANSSPERELEGTHRAAVSFLVLLAVPVLEVFRSDHHANPAEIGFVRTRVVDDVGAADARAVTEQRQPTFTRPAGVWTPAPSRTRHAV